MAEQGSTDKSTQSTDPSGCPDVDNGGTKTNRPVSVSKFMMSNKIESIMWLLRIFTLVSTFFFLFPILGQLATPVAGTHVTLVAEGGQFYQRALLANALTSACRLHQRLPRFRFSRAYVTQALLEDSCHYLLYSLIFITSHPITLCLVPVAVFSLLHATAYTRKILDIIGPSSVPWVRSFLDKMTTHQQSLFKFIAYNEILLMPAAVFMLFGLILSGVCCLKICARYRNNLEASFRYNVALYLKLPTVQADVPRIMDRLDVAIMLKHKHANRGRAHLFLPFFYYRFLTLRYASRRNPYCRTLFYELRVAMEQMTARPSCPTFIRSACHKAIKLICKLAPGS